MQAISTQALSSRPATAALSGRSKRSTRQPTRTVHVSAAKVDYYQYFRHSIQWLSFQSSVSMDFRRNAPAAADLVKLGGSPPFFEAVKSVPK